MKVSEESISLLQFLLFSTDNLRTSIPRQGGLVIEDELQSAKFAHSFHYTLDEQVGVT